MERRSHSRWAIRAFGFHKRIGMCARSMETLSVRNMRVGFVLLLMRVRLRRVRVGRGRCIRWALWCGLMGRYHWISSQPTVSLLNSIRLGLKRIFYSFTLLVVRHQNPKRLLQVRVIRSLRFVIQIGIVKKPVCLVICMPTIPHFFRNSIGMLLYAIRIALMRV